jgi:hypothetical protein
LNPVERAETEEDFDLIEGEGEGVTGWERLSSQSCMTLARNQIGTKRIGETYILS